MLLFTYCALRLLCGNEIAHNFEHKVVCKVDTSHNIIWSERQEPVYIVSNAHLPATTFVNRKNADDTIVQVTCPNIVNEYNRYMGGVDLADQLKGYYGVDRNTKHWWICLFFTLLIYQLPVHTFCTCTFTKIHQWPSR